MMRGADETLEETQSGNCIALTPRGIRKASKNASEFINQGDLNATWKESHSKHQHGRVKYADTQSAVEANSFKTAEKTKKTQQTQV